MTRTSRRETQDGQQDAEAHAAEAAGSAPAAGSQMAEIMESLARHQVGGGFKPLSKVDLPIEPCTPGNMEQWSDSGRDWSIFNGYLNAWRSPAERTTLGIADPGQDAKDQLLVVLRRSLPYALRTEVRHFTEPSDLVAFVRRKYRGNTITRMLACKREMHSATQLPNEGCEAYISRLIAVRDKCASHGYSLPDVEFVGIAMQGLAQ